MFEVPKREACCFYRSNPAVNLPVCYLDIGRKPLPSLCCSQGWGSSSLQSKKPPPHRFWEPVRPFLGELLFLRSDLRVTQVDSSPGCILFWSPHSEYSAAAYRGLSRPKEHKALCLLPLHSGRILLTPSMTWHAAKQLLSGAEVTRTSEWRCIRDKVSLIQVPSQKTTRVEGANTKPCVLSLFQLMSLGSHFALV